jgi:hypothetical protein
MSPERMGGFVPQEAMPEPPLEDVEVPPEMVELSADQLKVQQSELHGKLVDMSKELMNAALRGETAKIVELTGKIEQVHGQFKELDEKMRLAKERADLFKDLTKEEINLAVEPIGEFSNLTEDEINNAVNALGAEEEPFLLTPDMMKSTEVTDEMIISVEPAGKSEVEESLDELRQIEKDRVAQEAAEKGEAEKSKGEVAESLAELRQIEKDRVAREAAEKAAEAEKPPTAAEVKDALKNNELTPERKAVLEKELRRMENQLFEIENGAELIDRETGKTENRLGLKELESKFKSKFGLDLAEMSEKKAVSRWASLKMGVRSLFSRDYRQTVRQYEERTKEYNDMREDIDLTKLQIKDPKKYSDLMNLRLLKLGLVNAKRRASANRPANMGIGTMKF